MENKTNGTKVRYGVHYGTLNYEYALHSGKRHFLRNIADVINVIEYCVTKELKNNDYKGIGDNAIEVVRFVNDKIDETWSKDKFANVIKDVIERIIEDNVQRNS